MMDAPQVAGALAILVAVPGSVGKAIDSLLLRRDKTRLASLVERTWVWLDDLPVPEVDLKVIEWVSRRFHRFRRVGLVRRLFGGLVVSVIYTSAAVLFVVGHGNDPWVPADLYILGLYSLPNVISDGATALVVPFFIGRMASSPRIRVWFILLDIIIETSLVVGAPLMAVSLLLPGFVDFDTALDWVIHDVWQDKTWVSLLVLFGGSQVPTLIFYAVILCTYLLVLLARLSRWILSYFLEGAIEDAKKPEDTAVFTRLGVAFSLLAVPMMAAFALLDLFGVVSMPKLWK